MPKMSSVSGSWSQIIKLCVNLKPPIHKCAVDPNAIIGEPSAVLSLAVVGCKGVYNNLQSSCKWSI